MVSVDDETIFKRNISYICDFDEMNYLFSPFYYDRKYEGMIEKLICRNIMFFRV